MMYTHYQKTNIRSFAKSLMLHVCHVCLSYNSEAYCYTKIEFTETGRTSVAILMRLTRKDSIVYIAVNAQLYTRVYYHLCNKLYIQDQCTGISNLTIIVYVAVRNLSTTEHNINFCPSVSTILFELDFRLPGTDMCLEYCVFPMSATRLNRLLTQKLFKIGTVA